MNTPSKKTLSVFGLVMINVIAIDSLRSLPLNAVYGVSVIFYYALIALLFFIPSALVAAELATAWPETGGIYIWVREAFGKRVGFITIWLQWFYNVCWYPTIMSLVAATLAYLIDPQLVDHKLYMLTVIMAVYWGATIVNCLGMRASGALSTFAAIVGTIIPMMFIVLLGCVWIAMGKPVQVEWTTKALLPDCSSINSFVLLTAMLYSLVGMELSAAHAGEVKNPQRDYPRAVLWSGLIILATMILGSLAIAIVVPLNQLNIVSGLLQAFDIFFQAFHLSWLMPIIAILIIFGAIGGAAAWMLGPSKGLLIASRDGSLPASFGTVNAHHAPVKILFFQGIIFSLLCSVYLLMPTVSSAFWLLSNITAILSLIVYVVMFSAALRLRYKHPDTPRTFRVPGGQFGIWLVCLCGLISCIVTIVIGFLPPDQIAVGSVFLYETLLSLGVVLGCIAPIAIFGWYQKRTSA